MALPHGTNKSDLSTVSSSSTEGGTFRLRLLRFTGFYSLAGAAILLFAGTMLLPGYARNLQMQHRLKCERMKIDNSRKTIEAMRQFAVAAEQDEVLLSRLGTSRIGLYPENEVVRLDVANNGSSPAMLSIPAPDYPPPPSNWIVRYGKIAEVPTKKRGILFMAICLLVGATLIFPPEPRN